MKETASAIFVRNSQASPRTGRDAKRNLAPAREEGDEKATISQEHCPCEPEVPFGQSTPPSHANAVAGGNAVSFPRGQGGRTEWRWGLWFPLPWRAGGSVRPGNASVSCQCGGCRKCGLFPVRDGWPNGMEVGFAVFFALASGISVTDSRLFVTLRTNERVTSIPFCRKRDEGNRKRNLCPK